MSTTPWPNQHQMSPEPFLFSPLTSLFSSLLLFPVWNSTFRVDGDMRRWWWFGHPAEFYFWWFILWDLRTSPRRLVLSGLKNEHHCILNTVMHSFPWNWAKPGKKKVASLPSSLFTLSAWLIVSLSLSTEEWECPLWPKRQQTTTAHPKSSGTLPVDTLHSHCSLNQGEKTNLLLHLSAVRTLLPCSDQTKQPLERW